MRCWIRNRHRPRTLLQIQHAPLRTLCGNASQPQPACRPVSRFAESQPAPIPLQKLTQNQLAELEKLLSQSIGEMARMIIKKAARHLSTAALMPALATHSDRPEERSRFKAAVQKLLFAQRGLGHAWAASRQRPARPL
ncbi:MAG: hypothetical protein V4614_02530 [Pseudomonadota bacterium]